MARAATICMALSVALASCEDTGSADGSGTTGADTGSSEVGSSSGGVLGCEDPAPWIDPIREVGADEPGLQGVASVAVSGDRAYACTDGAGVVVWDVTDATAPILVVRDAWPAGAGPARCDQVAVSPDGSSIVVARRSDPDDSGGMVGTFDIGAGDEIVPAGSGLDGETVHGVSVLDDGRIAVSAGVNGVRLVAEAGDGSLAEMGSFFDADSDARRAAVVTDRLVVAEGRSGVRVYDVAGADPTLLGAAGLGANAIDVEVDALRALAYVATIDNVAIVDIAGDEPQVLAQVPTPSTAVEVVAHGEHVLVADWERVRMLDVTDPMAPTAVGDETIAGSAAMPRARAVAMAGERLLIGEWTGLHVHDLQAEPAAPDILLDTRALTFPSVGVGDSDDRVVVLRNAGSAPLEICTITPQLEGLSVDTTSATVEPGAAFTFEVSWSPAVGEAVEGSLAIASDDPDEPVVEVSIRGNDPGIGVGDPLPAFFHIDHDGRVRKNADLEGNVAILAYFATWCGACNEHFPDYETVLWQAYRDEGLVMFGLGNETLAKILAFATNTGATFPLLLGETTYSSYDDPPGSNYSLEVVVDRQGIVRAIGHEELTAQELEPLVVELLAE